MISNCILEAIKQKIFKPKTKIFIGFHKKGFLFIHCWWSYNDKTYHFTHDKDFNCFFNRIWFSGHIEKVNNKICKFYYYIKI
jgi:hypothetical protein